MAEGLSNRIENILGSRMAQWTMNQLNLRSEKNAKDNRDNSDHIYLQNKTGWVRLVSSIDIEDSDAIDYFKKTIGISGIEKGSSLAKQFVLFGGVSAYKDVNQKYSPRGGILNATPAYGILGNEEIRKYGYKPMPGISDVRIVTQGKLGSLRGATINFKVWDKYQLDVIDALYFKLGYSMFLEWGSTVYFKSEDPKKLLNAEDIAVDPFSSNMDKDSLRYAIRENIVKSEGNYDAMLGLVTNYTFELTGDGGYDCSINLQSLGTLGDSLRINNAGPYSDILTSAIKDIVSVLNQIRLKKAKEEAAAQLKLKQDIIDEVNKKNKEADASESSKSSTQNQPYTYPENYPICIRKKLGPPIDIGNGVFAMVGKNGIIKGYNFFYDGKYAQVVNGKTLTGTYACATNTENSRIILNGTVNVPVDTLSATYAELVAGDPQSSIITTSDTTKVFRKLNLLTGNLGATFEYVGYDNFKTVYRTNTTIEPGPGKLNILDIDKFTTANDTNFNRPTDLLQFYGNFTTTRKNFIRDGLKEVGNASYTGIRTFKYFSGDYDKIPKNNFLFRRRLDDGKYESVVIYKDNSDNIFGIYMSHPYEIKGFTRDDKKPSTEQIDNYVLDLYTEEKAQKALLEVLYGSETIWKTEFLSGKDFDELDPNGQKPLVPDGGIKFSAKTTVKYQKEIRTLDLTGTPTGKFDEEGQPIYQKVEQDIKCTVEIPIIIECTDLSILTQLDPPLASNTHAQATDAIGTSANRQAAANPPASEVKEEEKKQEVVLLDFDTIQVEQVSKYASVVESILRTLQLDAYSYASKRYNIADLKTTIPISPVKDKSNDFTDVMRSLFSNTIAGIDYQKYINGFTPPNSNTFKSFSQSQKVEVAAAYGYHYGLLANSTLLDDPEFFENYKVNYISLMNRYIIPYKQSQTLFEGTDVSYPVYIPLGFFIMILNHSSLLYVKQPGGKSESPILYVDYNQKSNLCLTTNKTITTDPYKFFIPYEGNTETYRSIYDKLDIPNDKLKTFWNPKDKNPISTIVSAANPFRVENGTTSGQLSAYRGKVMNVLVSIDYLLSLIRVHASADSTNSATLKPLLEEIISDMGKSFGNTNVFRLGFNDESDCYFISDDQIVPSAQTLTPTNKSQIPLFGKNSIAKSLSIKTDVSTKLGNLIAVSANSNITEQATAGKDGTSFGSFNANFKDRYKPVLSESKPLSKAEKDAADKKAKTDKAATTKTIHDAAAQFDSAVRAFYDQVSNSEGMVNTATNYYIDRMAEVVAMDTGSRASAMIPVALNFSTDGISGLGMLNGFTIDDELLPYNYRRNLGILGTYNVNYTIGFIIVGLDHTLTNGKWTTDVRANMAYIKSIESYSGKNVEMPNTSTTMTTLSNSGGSSGPDTDFCPYKYKDDRGGKKEASGLPNYASGPEYFCAAIQVTRKDESVNTSNFNTYYPKFTYKKGKSDIDLDKVNLAILSEKEIIEDTSKNKFLLGTIAEDGDSRRFIIHHTAGNVNDTADQVYTIYYQRGFPAQYVIDSDSRVHRFMPDGAKGFHARDNNNDTIGVEIIAGNNSEVSDPQMKTAVRLAHFLGIKKANIFGHGEVNSHKAPDEGKKVVDYIRQYC